MKCAEVIEWMHRYLDHDLSHEEITEMYRHIDACPSCAEVFDRLTTLSRQLEQLPDVKAPFSLVDAILPQLDELDRARLESGQSAAEEQNVVVPFSRTAAKGKNGKGKSSSMARRTGIGAVAAALILGIAIFNMPEKLPGAEVEQLFSKSGANDSASNSAEAPMMESFDADSANGADSGAEEQSAAANSGIDNRDTASTGDEASKYVAGADEPAVADRVTDGPAVSEAPAKPDGSSSDVKPSDGMKANLSEQRNNSSGGTGDNAAADSSGNNDSAVNDKGPIAEEKGIMAFIAPTSSPVADELSWTSSDGQHLAVVEGQSLVIYSVPASGLGLNKVLMSSIPLEGKWVSGEWLADNLQFRYVTENNGVEVQKAYIIPDEGTSAALPSTAPAATATSIPAATPTTK